MDGKQFGSHRIHPCSPDDVADLMRFIGEHYAADHVLSYHRELLDWLYYDEARDRYNFALARSNETDELIGVLGFIPTSHYDPDLADRSVTWLSMWQVREDAGPSGFGLQLLNVVSNYRSPVAVGAIGINDDVARIYRRLKYQVTTLDHHYMVNETLDEEDLSLVDRFDGRYTAPEYDSVASAPALRDVTADFEGYCDRGDLDFLGTGLPALSARYVTNRYVEHPFFDYRVYAVERGTACEGLLAVRPASHGGATALRWVEYLGEPAALRGLGPELQSLLREEGAEYLDIYSAGIDPERFAEAGMLTRDPDPDPGSDVVVPNYYEPFERRNVEIDVAYRVENDADPVVYNGHGDMDRPNDPD